MRNEEMRQQHFNDDSGYLSDGIVTPQKKKTTIVSDPQATQIRN